MLKKTVEKVVEDVVWILQTVAMILMPPLSASITIALVSIALYGDRDTPPPDTAFVLPLVAGAIVGIIVWWVRCSVVDIKKHLERIASQELPGKGDGFTDY